MVHSISRLCQNLGIPKILTVAVFCLYFTCCVALTAAISYPIYAIKYLLTAICPAAVFVLVLSIVRGKAFKALVIIQAVYLAIINVFLLYNTFLNGVPVANEGFFVIFEAFSPEKVHENWGWMKANFSVVGVTLVVAFIAGFVFLTRRTLRYAEKKANIPFIIIVTILLLGVGLYKYKNVPELLSKYQQSAVIINYDRYRQVVESMKSVKDYTDTISFKADCSYIEKKPLYVIVIGESATRHHWGIYGYGRDTTPLMQKRENAFFFKDAVAASAYTIVALTNCLTIQDAGGKRISLVDFYNKSGLHTELYSNQPEGGRDDTALGYLFNNTQHKYYTSRFGQYAKHDDIIVDKAIESIKNNDAPTAIFIHLLGSHVDFYDRYPEEFAVFSSSDVVEDKPYIPQFKKKLAALRINSYDNSIYYTDFLLDKIIDAVEETGRYGFVFYFSDHGEENFEFRNHFGRGGLNSKVVYDIPMMLWTSAGFLRDHQEMLTGDILRRPIWMGDLLPSLADLSGISSQHLDLKKSFFRQTFETGARLCDGNPYDTLEGPPQAQTE